MTREHANSLGRAEGEVGVLGEACRGWENFQGKWLARRAVKRFTVQLAASPELDGLKRDPGKEGSANQEKGIGDTGRFKL